MSNGRKKLTARVSLALLALAALTPGAAAQDYPNRPIRLIVPFAPGGVNDVIARLWAEKVKPHLGTVVVENRGGAGGMIGTAEVAKADPDGYTILLGSTTTQIINPAVATKVTYDPLNDFAAVAITASTATSIAVHPSLPVKSLKDLIDYAKANPGKLSYGSAGSGTITNLTGELFKQLAGNLEIVHIPYKGAGPAITDALSGHIAMITPNVTGQVLELHQTGKIHILAVAAPSRLRAAPDIPTAIEAGLPGMVGVAFSGLFVPAATPKAIVDKINEGTQKALKDEEMQQVLVKSGFEPVLDMGADKAQRFVADEHARWTPIIKASGFKLD
jgi:tripartite-type tricarboxylate transporter receptor subunit TctC